MAAVFIGESVHKVDSKGRVSIPSDFRAVLQEHDPEYNPARGARVVVNYYKRPAKSFLQCYTVSSFNALAQQILAMPAGAPHKDMLQTLYISKAHPAMVDETGRMVLPAKCRDPFGISDEAVFMAAGDTFKIMTPRAYEAEMAALESYLNALDDNIDPLSLLHGLPHPGAAQ